MKKIVFVCLVIALFTSADALSKPLDGAIIVRVDDGEASTCINLNKHQISLHLRRLLIEKESGIFTSDKEAGLVLKSTMNASNIETRSRSKITYPLMFQTPLEDYSSGVVSVPVEQRLFHRFRLIDEINEYDSIDLEFIVLSKKTPDNFGAALHHLTSISKRISLPANPFVDTFQTFAEYADNVVSDSLTESNNVKEALKEGNIVFSFSDNDSCQRDEEKTGTIAVVKNIKGSEDDGIVDITNESEYCWNANFRPTFTLKFAKKINGTCDGVKYKQVNNPYYAFILNAEEYDSVGIVNSLKSESLRRCSQHGITEESCM